MNFLGLKPVLAFIAAVFVIGGTAYADALVFPKYSVAVSSGEKKVLTLNKHLTLLIRLNSLAADAPAVTDLSFDARMPQHKHGMVTTAKVTRVNDHEFKVEGVRLHMPGAWVLDFILHHKNGETKISVPFELAPH